MAPTEKTSQVYKGGFLYSGVVFPPWTTDAVGCVPPDDEMRQQAEVEAACKRYQLAHPKVATEQSASS